MKSKTVLKRKIVKKDDEPAVINNDYTQSKIIKGKTSLGKNKNKSQQVKAKPEKNNSENLIEQIILTYFAARWQNKINAMKNRVTSRPNKKSKDVRTLVRVLQRAINYHTYLNLIELYDNMTSLPVPEGVKHDPNYGKIFLVKKEEPQVIIENEGEQEDVIKTKLRNDQKPPQRKTNEENYDDELAMYYYRNDGRPLDRVEIEKDIDKLMKEFPDKDIDVDRILHSKRLQYKLKHPRFSPFTKIENLDSFMRYLYTYKPDKNKNNEKIVVIQNKTYAYY
jgi:hypothetical protein